MKLTQEQALEKIKNWCAYQERYHKETKDKLFDFGLSKEEVEECLAQLISENFLNEERFAIAFAGGKFRIKNWGKNKIKTELRLRKVSDYSINKALKTINEEDYLKVLEKIVLKKWNSIQEKNEIKKTYKTLQYAVSRGFESSLVSDCIKQITE
ncbi:MAG: RecX family transcriptional regulator [Bacteroidia bacterium]|nr:RecX family transcriptional regulator [Bacteroidia bacterium]